MITNYHRLPLTDWFYSIEHSKAISGMAWLGYIPDSTDYKSTASGAKNIPEKIWDGAGEIWNLQEAKMFFSNLPFSKHTQVCT